MYLHSVVKGILCIGTDIQKNYQSLKVKKNKTGEVARHKMQIIIHLREEIFFSHCGRSLSRILSSVFILKSCILKFLDLAEEVVVEKTVQLRA